VAEWTNSGEERKAKRGSLGEVKFHGQAKKVKTSKTRYKNQRSKRE
jgi:hypothetical protein